MSIVSHDILEFLETNLVVPHTTIDKTTIVGYCNGVVCLSDHITVVLWNLATSDATQGGIDIIHRTTLI